MSVKKLNVLSYFQSKPLPKGFYLNHECFPKKPISINSLKDRIFCINCDMATRFDCATSTYLRKIRKIEKDFGVKNVGGGSFVGGYEYDNDFEFPETTIAKLGEATKS